MKTKKTTGKDSEEKDRKKIKKENGKGEKGKEEMKTKRNLKSGIMIAAVLVFMVLCVGLGVGMTYAYFASKFNKDLGAVTIGRLKLDGVTQTDGAEFTLPTEPIVPNQHIANVSLKAQVTSNIPYYTRVMVGARVTPKEENKHIAEEDQYCADYVENDVEILDIKIGDSVVEGAIQGESWHQASKQNLNGENVYYRLSPTSVESSLEGTTNEENFALSIQLKDFVGKDFCTYYMEAEIKINVKVEVVQADYLEEANTGVAFEDVETMNSTWEVVSPTEYDIDYFKGTFADSSWELIDAVARTGRASEVFHVGEEKTFWTTDHKDITVVILDFNHDELSDRTGKAGITLGMKDCLSSTYKMNTSNTNAGGWEKSELRTSTMQTIFNTLPEDLKPFIKTVNKKSTIGSQSRQITTTQDKLWLLSVAEIWTEAQLNACSETWIKNYADTLVQEGNQYAYYAEKLKGIANARTSSTDLVKKVDNGRGSANYWWLRSPILGNIYGFFFRVGSAGDCNHDDAYVSSGVSFGFCI